MHIIAYRTCDRLNNVTGAICPDPRLDHRHPSRQPNLDRTILRQAGVRLAMLWTFLRAHMVEGLELLSFAAHP